MNDLTETLEELKKKDKIALLEARLNAKAGTVPVERPVGMFGVQVLTRMGEFSSDVSLERFDSGEHAF